MSADLLNPFTNAVSLADLASGMGARDVPPATPKEFVAHLAATGHLQFPFGREDRGPFTAAALGRMTLKSRGIRDAIASYQTTNAYTLDLMSAQLRGRRSVVDGEVDVSSPESSALLRMPHIARCGCPDFDRVAAAVGDNRSFPAGCDPSRPQTHVNTVRVDKSRMPAFLNPVFESHVWPAVVRHYARVGLLLKRDDSNPRANHLSSWEPLAGSTIGLALKPWPGSFQCATSLWNRYDPTYKPANIVREWITLILHELGHNLSLDHTSGGVMNPGLIPGLDGWVNDPCWPLLARFFGGVAVDLEPTGPDAWIRQTLHSRNGRELSFDLNPPLVIQQG
jgi:hypothetical protein